MKFDVTTTVTVTCRTVVEADNEDSAKIIARERSLMDPPYNLGGDENTEFVVEDFDVPDEQGMAATPHDEEEI